jgi:thiol-disulfide isomerase/thioredoxin
MNYLSLIGGAALALVVLAKGPDRGLRAADEMAGDGRTPADSSYTLHGNIAGLDTGWVFLHHHGDGPTDSAIVSHGRFSFTGSVSEPEFCHLIFKMLNHVSIYSMGFFIQPGYLELRGKKDSLSSAVTVGAPIQEEYLGYSKRVDSAVDWGAWGRAAKLAAAEKNKPGLDSLSAAATEMDNRQKQLAKEYAAAHPSSYVAVFEVLSYFSYNPDAEELQTVFSEFTPAIQASYLGSQLKKIVEAAVLTGVGRPAPEFTQADVKGKPVNLSSYKGQYVLVDFWASWCGPCREENPNVLKAYRKYHSKGFTVLGVSLDNKKENWLEAVRKDGLPWTQVSDLQGWKNAVAVLYGIQGIPMNYLVDKNGKIIAKELRGEDLDKTLATSLQ